MFDIGLQELLVIGVIALLVFGPSRLPELGRMAGRAMREFRRASDEFRSTVETNLHINDPDPVIQPPVPLDASASSLPLETEPQLLEPASPPETAVNPADADEPYCAQRGSRLFHRRECSWVARIPEVERVYLKLITDAHEEGYRECPVCEPWEPS